MVEHVWEGSIGILLIIVLENGYLWLFVVRTDQIYRLDLWDGRH